MNVTYWAKKTYAYGAASLFLGGEEIALLLKLAALCLS